MAEMANVDKDLEELMSHLGDFGKYQFRQICLHLLAALTAGLHMLTLLTVAAVPAHHCDIPKPNVSSVLTKELFNFTIYNWNSSDVLEHLPRRLDSCHYLDRENITRECDTWTYDTTHFQSSRGMEWNFVCSRRWMGAVAQSSYMFGAFVGSFTLGSMADKYGRKITFYVSAVAQLVLGILVALVNDYYVFLAIRFLYAFGSAGAYITGFVLTMELVGPSRRTVCGILFPLAYAIGFMVVAMWGAIIKNRMWLQIVYGMHGVILLGHWWLMDESPKWLWAHGRADEAIIIVQRGLKMNGSDGHMDSARLISRSKIQKEIKKDKSYGALDLFKTPNLRKKSLNLYFNWFANSIAYYGLALNNSNFVGNPFIMLFLSGVLEIPTYILVIFTMDRTGRRCLVSTFMIIGGICCICAAIIIGTTSSNLTAVATVAIVFVGKSCIAGSFAVVYNYTAELYPTVVRNTAIGIGFMCACISSVFAPMIFLLDSLDSRIPATLFGLIALVAGFLALYLPETLNQPMPESIEDSENFGKGDTCFTTCIGNGIKIVNNRHIIMSKIQEENEKEKLNDI